MNNYFTLNLHFARAAYFFFLTCPFIAESVELTNRAVKITMTVLAEPCTINDNNESFINFGTDLEISKIDGINYRKEIPLSLICKSLSQNELTLTFLGKPASFDGNILDSGKDSLGVRIFSDGNILPIGEPLKFTYPLVPKLEAVPVSSNINLTPGTFEAIAIVEINYQ